MIENSTENHVSGANLFSEAHMLSKVSGMNKA